VNKWIKIFFEMNNEQQLKGVSVRGVTKGGRVDKFILNSQTMNGNRRREGRYPGENCTTRRLNNTTAHCQPAQRAPTSFSMNSREPTELLLSTYVFRRIFTHGLRSKNKYSCFVCHSSINKEEGRGSVSENGKQQ